MVSVSPSGSLPVGKQTTMSYSFGLPGLMKIPDNVGARLLTVIEVAPVSEPPLLSDTAAVH